MTVVDAATHDLDIGLVISNAGTGLPKQFLAATRDELHATVRLNVSAHLDIAHRLRPVSSRAARAVSSSWERWGHRTAFQ